MDFLLGSQIIQKIGEFLQDEAIAILISIIAIYFTRTIIIKLSNRLIKEDTKRYKIKKNSRYITTTAALIWLLLLYNSHSSDGNTFPLFIVGIFLAGVTFTLRGVFSSILGWFLIVSNKGFVAGDRVEINDIRGDVIDIGILRTTVAEVGDWDDWGEQSTGKLISIPNSAVLEKNVVNYSRGFDTIWSEIFITITFESDWKKAEEILNEIAQQDFAEHQKQFAQRMHHVKREFMVSYTYITPKVYVKIEESGITLILRHMVSVRERRIIYDKISRKILEAFENEQEIEFAYPTIRYYKRGE